MNSQSILGMKLWNGIGIHEIFSATLEKLRPVCESVDELWYRSRILKRNFIKTICFLFICSTQKIILSFVLNNRQCFASKSQINGELRRDIIMVHLIWCIEINLVSLLNMYVLYNFCVLIRNYIIIFDFLQVFCWVKRNQN